jgi:hypothetical protein
MVFFEAVPKNLGRDRYSHSSRQRQRNTADSKTHRDHSNDNQQYDLFHGDDSSRHHFNAYSFHNFVQSHHFHFVHEPSHLHQLSRYREQVRGDKGV